MARILVVEDEADIAMPLADDLRLEEHEVEVVSDGREAADRGREATWDLIILDVMLPRKDGFEVCRELRKAGVRTPIILLTAKSHEAEKIMGLDLGADDYVTKPFNPRELRARIGAVLRRAEGPAQYQSPRRLGFGVLVADLDARSLVGAGETIVELTAAEFDLLACFLERPKRVLSRDQLLDWTRGRAADPYDRTIDVSVSRLRRKLVAADPQVAVSIKTVRNGGYLFAADVRAL